MAGEGQDTKGNTVSPIKGGIGMKGGKETMPEKIYNAIGIQPQYPPGLKAIKGGIGLKGKG